MRDGFRASGPSGTFQTQRGYVHLTYLRHLLSPQRSDGCADLAMFTKHPMTSKTVAFGDRRSHFVPSPNTFSELAPTYNQDQETQPNKPPALPYYLDPQPSPNSAAIASQRRPVHPYIHCPQNNIPERASGRGLNNETPRFPLFASLELHPPASTPPVHSKDCLPRYPRARAAAYRIAIPQSQFPPPPPFPIPIPTTPPKWPNPPPPPPPAPPPPASKPSSPPPPTAAPPKPKPPRADAVPSKKKEARKALKPKTTGVKKRNAAKKNAATRSRRKTSWDDAVVPTKTAARVTGTSKRASEARKEGYTVLPPTRVVKPGVKKGVKKESEVASRKSSKAEEMLEPPVASRKSSKAEGPASPKKSPTKKASVGSVGKKGSHGSPAGVTALPPTRFGDRVELDDYTTYGVGGKHDYVY
ncbi:uncharacterized protein BDZ99DRAFT_541974 [Mytilinidion resinicola]|uniref:Uncharacterized protein n=1 Tax=Mytilinidion resinicola TaxID=574789 RepID=A0A6A6Z5B8_9PEZI|nr:uncharacterized protein BDZ99DRAFT_541974 [Mytilinidion resinicola]KAF2815929.1 hypothetical protein BDZ99DRAFT_541974 [Mytilinidion resinicola]